MAKKNTIKTTKVPSKKKPVKKSSSAFKSNKTKELEEALNVEKEKYLRLFAEFENYKKRTSKERLELFKTANEINQIWLVEHAYKRQEFICQAQSLNLFFTLPSATEEQQVHDTYMQYVSDVHWYGMHKLKSLYYFRTNAARNVENVNTKIPRINLEDVECISCEG